MSAFICSDRQFAVVAKSIFVDARRQQQFADALKRENIRSINHRYKERNRFTKVKLSACPDEEVVWYLNDDVAALLDCIDYQSCEHPDYNDLHYKLADILLRARGADPKRSSIWCI